MLSIKSHCCCSMLKCQAIRKKQRFLGRTPCRRAGSVLRRQPPSCPVPPRERETRAAGRRGGEAGTGPAEQPCGGHSCTRSGDVDRQTTWERSFRPARQACVAPPLRVAGGIHHLSGGVFRHPDGLPGMRPVWGGCRRDEGRIRRLEGLLPQAMRPGCHGVAICRVA